MRLVATLALVAGIGQGTAQTAADFFDDSLLQEVRLTIHPADWRRLQDTFSPTQINFQTPWEIAPGKVPVTALFNGRIGTTFTADVEAVSPGIFAVVHADGSAISPDRPAQAGDIVVIYANGLGPVTASGRTTNKPLVTIAGLPTELLYSGLAPGFAGLYQPNTRLPASLPSGMATPLLLSLAGRNAPPAPIATR